MGNLFDGFTLKAKCCPSAVSLSFASFMERKAAASLPVFKWLRPVTEMNFDLFQLLKCTLECMKNLVFLHHRHLFRAARGRVRL